MTQQEPIIDSRPEPVLLDIGHWSLVIGFLLVALIAAAARAADPADSDETPDRVTLLMNDGAGRITMQCRVVDYTGKLLTVRPKMGTALREFDASQVIDVQTPQVKPHVDGMEKFRNRDFPGAKTAFEEALVADNRAWVRREILAMLVRCALAQGDSITAGNRFLQLMKSDPDSRYLFLAPLPWGTQDASAELKGTARGWQGQKSEPARLLAAACLLHDERSSVDAGLELRSLSASTSPAVAALAQSQLWRRRLIEGDVSRDELNRWHLRTQEMPEKSRGGAYYVIGTGHRQRKAHDLAAACLLWVPLVYSEDAFLASRAQLEAADSLAQIGQRNEAMILYREVQSRYPQTPSAKEADESIKFLRDAMEPKEN